VISNHKIFFIEAAIMFLFFTPYTFFFLTFYFIFLLFLFSCSNFVIFWVFIEFIILIFIGVSYTLFLNNFSSLILYFLLQTVSSFRILLFYLFPIPLIFSMFVCIKLSIFPFHFWFINICYRFPNFVLFLVSSFHKIPVFLIFLLFQPSFRLSFLIVSSILTMLISGVIILSSVDFRAIIVSSSIGNNSWFLLSSFSNFRTFIVFFFTYCFFLYLLFRELSIFTKPLSFVFSKGDYTLLILITFIRGLPPFPIFFVKILILFSLIVRSGINIYLLIFVVSSSLMLIGYIYSMAKYFLQSFSSQSLYIL